MVVVVFVVRVLSVMVVVFVVVDETVDEEERIERRGDEERTVLLHAFGCAGEEPRARVVGGRLLELLDPKKIISNPEEIQVPKLLFRDTELPSGILTRVFHNPKQLFWNRRQMFWDLKPRCWDSKQAFRS